MSVWLTLHAAGSANRKMRAAKTVAHCLLAGCLLSGCSLAPQTEVPEPVVASPAAVADALPGSFAGGAEPGAHRPLEWWRAYGDPALDALVARALDANYDMAEAVARVEQAREIARIARAAFYPTVRARASVENFSVPTNAGIGAQLQELGLDEALGDFTDDFALPERLGLTTLTVGADVAYELDFWGRIRNRELAAGAEYLASESDYQTVRIGVLAETIATYFEVVGLRRQIDLVREIVAVIEEREQLAETRYTRGLASSLDAYRVRQDRLDTQAGLPQLESRLDDALGRLAVLLGGYRRDVEALLPESQAPVNARDAVPAGIPADLLNQRPDVRAAGHRLEAAGYDIETRRAALLPSLSFAGAIGLQNSRVAGLFNVRQWFSNLAANLLLPVLDGDRLQSDVTLAEIRFNEAAAAYGRTVVTAVNEVETALAGAERQDRRNAFLVSRHGEAQAAVDLQSERFASGVGGYADYLDALRTLLNVESALADSERDTALARLAIHRALGGAWTSPDGAWQARNLPVSTPAEGRSEQVSR